MDASKDLVLNATYELVGLNGKDRATVCETSFFLKIFQFSGAEKPHSYENYYEIVYRNHDEFEVGGKNTENNSTKLHLPECNNFRKVKSL